MERFHFINILHERGFCVSTAIQIKFSLIWCQHCSIDFQKVLCGLQIILFAHTHTTHILSYEDTPLFWRAESWAYYFIFDTSDFDPGLDNKQLARLTFPIPILHFLEKSQCLPRNVDILTDYFQEIWLKKDKNWCDANWIVTTFASTYL